MKEPKERQVLRHKINHWTERIMSTHEEIKLIELRREKYQEQLLKAARLLEEYDEKHRGIIH